MWSIISVCSVLIYSVYSQDTPTLELPVVTISQGVVLGTLNDDSYYEFHGIPYADSTSGTNRFKAPNPPPSFIEPFNANRRDIKCVRALGVGFEGTEDCLVANIFTSTINNAARLPVMVWVKGKEFDDSKDNALSFKHFVENGIVVVTLNFRESILGFLCLGTDIAPGNAGLKDIVAGLQWVQANIAQFGGDPDNVSIFGHGSGAAAVDLITLSPMASGLVHKAIAQSGSALAPWAVTRDNLVYAKQVAEGLGHEITTIEELSDIFTRTSVSALMAVINDLELTDNSLAFAPCVEKVDLEGVEPFLLKTPMQIIADGEQNQIPFMTGYVDNEGTIRTEEALEGDWLERMDISFEDFLQPDLKFENDIVQTQLAADIKQFYFENTPISLNNIDDYISYHGDTLILVSAIREVRRRAFTSNQAIYLYQFSYKGTLGDLFVGPQPVRSATHSEELAYFFFDSVDEISQRDLAVGELLIERWVNFAKFGTPSSETSHIEWAPFTVTNNNYLHILDVNDIDEATLEAELTNPHPETLMFWETIYEDHFFDAKSRWDLTESDDVEGSGDGSGDGSGEEDGSGDEVIVVDGSGEEDGNIDGGFTTPPPDSSESGEDEKDSASTAVGYTFLIISLFSVLSRFHNSQILS